MRFEVSNHPVGEARTAQAGKGKCLAQDRADLFVESLFHQRASTMESGLDRLGVEVEQRRRLLCAQPFDGAGDQDRAKIVRQLIDRSLQQLADFMLGQGTLRINRLAGMRKGDDLWV